MTTNNSINNTLISPGMASVNQYYGMGSVANGTNYLGSVSPVTGTLFFIPIAIGKAATYSRLSCFVTAALAATNINMGIYASTSDSTQPTGSPIVTSGSISAATTGQKNYDTSIALSSGIYWFAFSSSSSSVGIAAYQSPGAALQAGFIFGASSLSASLFIASGWTQTFVYSAVLPAVGALTADTNTSLCGMFIRL